MDNPIYEDKPPFSSSSYKDSLTKWFITSMPLWPVLLVYIVFFAYLIITHFRIDTSYYIFLYSFLFLLLLLELLTCATKHQIFKDTIRITRGWIFRFDIPFSNIENTREAVIKDLLGFHINFVPFTPGDDVVQITRKRGWKVNIIPGNRKLFLENLNKAMNEWKTHYVSY
jgi:hypothetical protein